MSPEVVQPLPPETPPALEAGLPKCVSVAGNELTIFTESPPLVRSMVEDIRRATTRVWLESYIILDDAVGNAVAEALKERARAGLDVRVHYDAVGSLTTPSRFFQDLQAAGVQVHCFHSLWEAFWDFYSLRILNRRNHRKLLVVDDSVAYFGGMNLVDQGGLRFREQHEQIPTSAGWRDVHVRLTGPAQAQVAESYERSWRRAKGLPVRRRKAAYRKARLAGGEESIQFFDSGPGRKHTRAARVFRTLLAGARERVVISMAYFLPVAGVLRELLRAKRRGVFLQILVPGNSDVQLVQSATRHLYAQLLRRRFHLYERQQNMLHSKVMVVDDQWCVLGSCNLDARSLWINLEFLAVIHSRNLGRVLEELVEYEVRHSRRVTLTECLARSRWRRFVDRLAWAFRWWL